jgi:hypothetical protein
MRAGTLISFNGSWMSGIAILVLKDEEGNTVQIPCDNSPTVRALNSLFPGFITNGHCIDNSAINGEPVLYCMDDMDLLLGGLAQA